jgi:hypothetical protein
MGVLNESTGVASAGGTNVVVVVEAVVGVTVTTVRGTVVVVVVTGADALAMRAADVVLVVVRRALVVLVTALVGVTIDVDVVDGEEEGGDVGGAALRVGAVGGLVGLAVSGVVALPQAARRSPSPPSSKAACNGR